MATGRYVEISYLYVSPAHIKGRRERSSQSSHRPDFVGGTNVINELDEVSGRDDPHPLGRSPSRRDDPEHSVLPNSGPETGLTGSSLEVDHTPIAAPPIAPDLGEYTSRMHNKRKSSDI